MGGEVVSIEIIITTALFVCVYLYERGESIMKWVYIALGLVIIMSIMSIMNKTTMYTSTGESVIPIHMGVEK